MIKIPQIPLTSDTVVSVAQQKQKTILAKKHYAPIISAYKFVNKLKDQNKPVYGVTTGFGALAGVILSQNKLKQLQTNLIYSHAVGSGPVLNKDIVRAAMFLRANMLAKAHSGVRIDLINTLLAMLNKDIVPVVPETGSVGASGDLSPLAFIARSLLGFGQVYYQNRVMKSIDAYKKANIKPIALEPKEGLALINGTEMMTANGALLINKSEYLADVADIASVLSVVSLQGKTEPFDMRIIELKPHPGQILVNKNLIKLLKGYQTTGKKVQDAYSIRCIPQIAGAVREGIKFAKNIIETEMNSVTDNPIIVYDSKTKNHQIISGGNFHGQSISLAFDTLGISLVTMGLISERRIFRILDDKLSGLPPFLVKEAGVNSGLMMLQVLASALCAENRILASPASIQSLPTSASQEDFVSMGMTGANKTRKICDNTITILAIELICARQAIELAEYPVPQGVKNLYHEIMNTVPFITDDRLYQEDIENVKALLDKPDFRKKVLNACKA